MKLTTPGRLAAAPQGPRRGPHSQPLGTEAERKTRIGFDALTQPHPLVACGNLSPRGRQSLFMRRGSRDALWSN